MKTCVHCKEEESKFTCEQCRSVHYCSAECQRNHWHDGQHQEVCRLIGSLEAMKIDSSPLQRFVRPLSLSSSSSSSLTIEGKREATYAKDISTDDDKNKKSKKNKKKNKKTKPKEEEKEKLPSTFFKVGDIINDLNSVEVAEKSSGNPLRLRRFLGGGTTGQVWRAQEAKKTLGEGKSMFRTVKIFNLQEFGPKRAAIQAAFVRESLIHRAIRVSGNADELCSNVLACGIRSFIFSKVFTLDEGTGELLEREQSIDERSIYGAIVFPVQSASVQAQDLLAFSSRLASRDEFDDDRAKEIMVALAQNITGALAALHEAKIYHFDVKPQNILVDQLDEGGTRFQPTILDFGGACIRGVNIPTIVGDISTRQDQLLRGIVEVSVLGADTGAASGGCVPLQFTALYADPDLRDRFLKGGRTFLSNDEAALWDVFSTGITVYELESIATRGTDENALLAFGDPKQIAVVEGVRTHVRESLQKARESGEPYVLDRFILSMIDSPPEERVSMREYYDFLQEISWKRVALAFGYTEEELGELDDDDDNDNNYNYDGEQYIGQQDSDGRVPPPLVPPRQRPQNPPPMPTQPKPELPASQQPSTRLQQVQPRPQLVDTVTQASFGKLLDTPLFPTPLLNKIRVFIDVVLFGDVQMKPRVRRTYDWIARWIWQKQGRVVQQEMERQLDALLRDPTLATQGYDINNDKTSILATDEDFGDIYAALIMLVALRRRNALFLGFTEQSLTRQLAFVRNDPRFAQKFLFGYRISASEPRRFVRTIQLPASKNDIFRIVFGCVVRGKGDISFEEGEESSQKCAFGDIVKLFALEQQLDVSLPQFNVTMAQLPLENAVNGFFEDPLYVRTFQQDPIAVVMKRRQAERGAKLDRSGRKEQLPPPGGPAPKKPAPSGKRPIVTGGQGRGRGSEQSVARGRGGRGRGTGRGRGRGRGQATGPPSQEVIARARLPPLLAPQT